MSLQSGNTPQGVAPSRQATMREFFAVLFRRRWLIVGLFVVVTSTVVTISLTTPTTYSSSGRVLVIRGERQSALSPGRQVFSDWEQELASEVANVRSTPVLERTRSLLEERAKSSGKKAPKIDFGAVDVEVMGKSNVLGIGYTDLDPEVAQQVCDALLTSYVEYRQNRQRLGTPEDFFVSKLDSLNAEIEKRLMERQQNAQASGVTNALDQAREWSGQLSLLEQRRNEAAADLAEAQRSLKAMRELQQNPDIDLPTLGMPFTNESALVALKQRMMDQQTRIATLRERFRDDAPEVQNAMETLETLQAMLRKEVEARLTMSSSRIESLRARLAVHERDLGELRARLGVIPGSQRRMDDLEAEIKNLRERYTEYSKARDMALITANTSQERSVVLLNPAGFATAQNARDYVRMALAPAFSLVIGIGLAFFIDNLDMTVRTAGQAEEYLEIPVFATLSERRKRG
ncbi:MAG: hypothetical protein IT348_15525 [Candidatus Eisenbacteria bacterium]|nr:hypothetical protein [Candidatus Eisenbacteria bacterium]